MKVIEFGLKWVRMIRCGLVLSRLKAQDKLEKYKPFPTPKEVIQDQT